MSATTPSSAAPHTARAAHARNTGSATTRFSPHSRALVVLIIAVVVLAILPDVVNFLHFKHLSVTVSQLASRSSLAKAARWAAAAALFLVCFAIALGRGHPERKTSGAAILLLAVIIPYLISPALPGTTGLVRIALAAAVFLTVWHIAAPVEGLKWVAIAGSLIGVYSIIGGLIIPQYMFGADSEKGLIGNWVLAGPFAHANILGITCVLALALSPLIVSIRWRILHSFVLCIAIAASASRTALVAAGVLVLWWIVCWSRSVRFIRPAGTAFLAVAAAVVAVLPLLSWSPYAFTGRAHIWTASLRAWKESPVVGLGIDWFTTTARSLPYFVSWENLAAGNGAFLPPHGHNLMVDTLVRSGLVGICLLILVLLAATRSARAMHGSNQQIACFGFLIVFLSVSSTEAIWVLLPDVDLFPVVGLVLAVIIAARKNSGTSTEQSSALLV
jgi:O-antigen ligase